jgi:hypothetical protein
VLARIHAKLRWTRHAYMYDDAMANDAGPTHRGPAEASSASLDDKSRYKVLSPTIRDSYDVTPRYAKIAHDTERGRIGPFFSHVWRS